MTRATLRTILVVAAVVLAGCSGGVPGGSPTGAAVTTDGADPSSDDGSADVTSGQVQFYLSDQPNAIDDFEHLNVTVTSVGFHRVGDGADDGTSAEGNVTTASNVSTAADANAPAEEGDEDGEGEGAEAEDDEDRDDEDDSRDDETDGEWVTYDVPNVTADLTRLVGANATRLAEFGVPAGEYDTVFVHVSEVNGTLAGGDDVRVKLPSGKLQLHSQFRLDANGSVDFVYDIAVHEAGKSGKYVLRPVVSESGTDQEFEDVDERDGEDDRRDGAEREGERDRDDREATLNATLRGNVTPGGNAALSVTRNGSAVANATVEVNGEVIGTTGDDGRLTFAVPEAGHLKVKAKVDGAEAELEREFDDGRRGEGRGNGS